MMNPTEAKNLVSIVRYLEAVAESLLIQSYDDGREPKDILKVMGEDIEENVIPALASVIKNLPAVDPSFSAIIHEVDREAFESGRKWTEERVQKIALLRLAGDDTPEDQIPN